MIYFLPIEQFEERYTQQWFEWFLEGFANLNVEFITINPPQLKHNLEVGDVLDIYNTNFYKMSQFTELMRYFNEGKIKDGDIIFLLDAWGAGLESLEYIRKMSGIKFKIAGILHAGSWDKNDFINRYEMNKGTHGVSLIEEYWLSIMDKIFVATRYHKELINDWNSSFGSKIEVVNFPLKITPDYGSIKKDLVVFPHRLDKEKQPELFDQLQKQYQDKIYFIKTKEVASNKQEYYDILKYAKVAVSFAKQETFGIAMLEACVHGCIPIVPDDLSYSEMYPSVFKYKLADKEEMIQNIKLKIRLFIDNYDRYVHMLPSIYSKYFNGAEQIIINLLELKEGK